MNTTHREDPAKRTNDPDLTPFMCLMVALVPILLLQAEFAEISIIDVGLPRRRGSTTRETVRDRPAPENKLLLTAIISDSALTLGAKGGFLPSLLYREYHRYVTRDDHRELTVEWDPDEPAPPRHPVTGRPLEPAERRDLILYSCERDTRRLRKALYTRRGELLGDPDGTPVCEAAPGDTLFALSSPPRMLVVKDPSSFRLRPLSLPDELAARLMKVKERFGEVDDRNNIIIAADSSIVYDKIVQVMDAARRAHFPEAFIAKPRG